MKRNFLLVALLLFFMCFLAEANDSLKWRGQESNSTYSMENWSPSVLNGKPPILWQKDVGEGYSSVTVEGDKVYTCGNTKNQDIIYCLDANTGMEIWHYAYDCNPGIYKGPYATPVIDGDYLYMISKKGLRKI